MKKQEKQEKSTRIWKGTKINLKFRVFRPLHAFVIQIAYDYKLKSNVKVTL